MSRPSPRVAAVAAVGAGGALLCAACCVAPFALSAATLASLGGVLAWFANGYAWTSLVAVMLVAGAWAWVGIQSARTRKRPAGLTLIVLGLATLVAVLALAWPLFEGDIIRVLRR